MNNFLTKKRKFQATVILASLLSVACGKVIDETDVKLQDPLQGPTTLSMTAENAGQLSAAGATSSNSFKVKKSQIGAMGSQKAMSASFLLQGGIVVR